MSTNEALLPNTNRVRATRTAFIVTVVCVAGAIIFAKPISTTISALPFGVGWGGMAIYVFATVCSTIVAPVSSITLIPIAATLWGPLATALLSSIGWSLGAVGAFLLAKRYGTVLVERTIGTERVYAYRAIAAPTVTFWRIVMLRMLMPVDVLSYLLGVSANIPLGTYALATLVGVLPGALLFSYATALPTHYQIVGAVLGIVLIVWWYHREKRKNRDVHKNVRTT